jgi:hypothetical protein
MVALPIPSEHARLVNEALSVPFDIFRTATPAGKKLHITDAFASADGAWKAAAIRARDYVFLVLSDISAAVIYGARRFSLAREAHERSESVSTAAKEAMAESRPELSFYNRLSRERVEAEAYEQLMLLLDCFGKDLCMIIRPRCDRTDAAIANAYIEKLTALRTASLQSHVAKAFNKATRTVETKPFKIGIQMTGATEQDLNVTNIADLEVQDSVGPELFAVDVLANSLADHLRGLSADASLYGPKATHGWRGGGLVWGSNREGLDAFECF